MDTTDCIQHIRKLAKERARMISTIQTVLHLAEEGDHRIHPALETALRGCLPEDERGEA